MNIEQQVVSLKLAKKLKGLGVKQESLFWWCNYDHIGGDRNDLWNVESNHVGYKEYCSAFTVAELGEVLPIYVMSGKKDDGNWYCATISNDMGWKEECFDAPTEADARAKMLIYLLENNLIKNI